MTASIPPRKAFHQQQVVDRLPSASTRLSSNPFATRYTRPGSLRYCFDRSALSFQSDCVEGNDTSDHDRSPDRRPDQNPVQRLVMALTESRAGLIVGSHGTGKSTLLHTLLPTLERTFGSVTMLRLSGCDSVRPIRRWQHLRQVDRELRLFSTPSTTSSGSGIWVIDGAEQISVWQRTRLLRWARRGGQAILATSHRPLMGMEVLYRTELNANLIHGLTVQLLTDASPEIEAMVRDELASRDLGRVSNLRELWFELYDVVQPNLGSEQQSKWLCDCP